MSRHSPSLSAIRALVAFLVFVATSVAFGAGAAKKSFDIPSGGALPSLKRFFSQSGEQLIYKTEAVERVKTNAVKGEFTPHEALNRMFAGTSLLVAQDPKNGALSLVGGPDPNGQKAARKTDSDRLQKNPERAPLAAPEPDETVELAPFSVKASQDVGYMARNTLGGTRLNTELRDVASQVSVMTAEFLEDIAATTLDDALAYSLNVENVDEFQSLASQGGNFAITVFNDDLRSRTRGLEQSTLTQDLFSSSVRADTYNSERITLASGPNAILFGLGSPAGLTDVSLKRARLDRVAGTVTLRADSEKSLRSVVDVSAPLIRQKLGARVVLLRDRGRDFREPATQNQDRVFGTLTYQPFKRTQLRLSFERVHDDSLRAKPAVVRDGITAWIDAGRPIFDNSGIDTRSTAAATTSRINATGQGLVFGRYGNANFTLPAGQLGGGQSLMGPLQWLGTVTTHGAESFRTAPDNVLGTLADSTVFPWDVNYNGNGSRNVTNAWTARFIAEQSLSDHLHFQFGYNREEKRQPGIWDLVSGVAQLGADANRYLPDGVTPNPNVGRLYFQNIGRSRVSRQFREREEIRFSATAKFDFTRRSSWLGKHHLLGVVSREIEFVATGTYDLRAFTPSAAAAAVGLTVNAPINVRAYVDDPRNPNDHGIYWLNLPFDPANNVTLPDGTQIGTINNPLGSTSGSANRSRLQSGLLALQSHWWMNRVVTTFGVRRDRNQSLARSLIDAERAVLVEKLDTGAFNDYPLDESDNTTNLGAVFHASKRLSFHYAQSTTFAPRLQGQTPYGESVPGAHGDGRDYGLTLAPFGDRMSLRVNFYENTAGPRRNARFQVPVGNQVTSIERGVAAASRQPVPAFADEDAATPFIVVSSNRSTGVELELVANPTSSWRLAITAAKTSATESGIGVPWRRYVLERTPLWARYADAPRFDSPTETIRDNFADIILNLNTMAQSDGAKVESGRAWRVNVTTRYAFTRGGLKNFFVGGAYRWRSPNVVGYGTRVIPNEFSFPGLATTVATQDITLPITGRAMTTVDGFAGYSKRILKGRLGWRVQLNVRNLFDDDGILLQQTFSDGSPRNFSIPSPRLFIVTNTFSF